MPSIINCECDGSCAAPLIDGASLPARHPPIEDVVIAWFPANLYSPDSVVRTLNRIKPSEGHRIRYVLL